MGKYTADFLAATKARRSLYALEAKSPVPDSEIVSLAEQALLNVPSAFNSQSTRVVILLKEDHKKLWDITGSTLKAKISSEKWEGGTKARMEGFHAAYGTILFFDDPGHEEPLKKMGGALYEDKVAEWTHQSQGMHQYFMWVALESVGFGANLQHYNPIINEEVQKTWGYPEQWRLRAQMVFGTPKEGSGPKDKEQKMEMDVRLKVHGADV